MPVVNSALDAPTFFVDNLINLSSMGGVVKLYFIENLADAAEKTFQARYAVTIAMTQIHS